MATDITTYTPAIIALPEGLPDIITDAGERAAWRFVEFFTATIRNPNTREAYARAVSRFLAWCEGRGLYNLHAIKPTIVAAYIEQFPGSKPTVKQHLAAIRQCFDWLVSGGVLETNPAASVKGPKYVIKKGKTPVLGTEPGLFMKTKHAHGIHSITSYNPKYSYEVSSGDSLGSHPRARREGSMSERVQGQKCGRLTLRPKVFQCGLAPCCPACS